MQQLSLFCRGLRQPLEAGLSLVDAARLAGQRSAAGQRLSVFLCERLKQGESLSDALAQFAPPLPDLFRAMVRAGEETGRLAETLASLEQYYDLQERLRRELRRRAFPLLLQFGLAVIVLAIVVGVTTSLMPEGGLSFLGLRGMVGAVACLLVGGGMLAFLIALPRLMTWLARRSPRTARLLRNLPGLGFVLESLLLSRFALALKVTLDSNLSLPRGLRMSFEASGDSVWQRRGAKAIGAVKKGMALTDALNQTRLLPLEFVEMVAVAEQSGSLPEQMGRLAQEYHQRALDHAQVLVRMMSLVLWLAYAAFMIWAISGVAGMYVGRLG